MSLIAIFLVLVTGLAVVGAIVLVIGGLSQSRSPLSAADQHELYRLRILVDDLKELAWDHREIDPDLATLMIDRIRRSERGDGPTPLS